MNEISSVYFIIFTLKFFEIQNLALNKIAQQLQQIMRQCNHVLYDLPQQAATATRSASRGTT